MRCELEKAKQAVREIVADITDRSGLGNAWYETDIDVQREIEWKWERIIFKVFSKQQNEGIAYYINENKRCQKE